MMEGKGKRNTCERSEGRFMKETELERKYEKERGRI